SAKAAIGALAVDERVPVAVPEPSARAMQFYWSGNWLWAINRIWALTLTGTLAFSSASSRLRSLAQRLGRNWFFTVGLYVILFQVIVWVLDLPLAYYQGFVRLHAYELSNQTLHKWLTDAVLRLGVAMAVGFAFAWIPYFLMIRWPRRWWLYTTILS